MNLSVLIVIIWHVRERAFPEPLANSVSTSTDSLPPSEVRQANITNIPFACPPSGWGHRVGGFWSVTVRDTNQMMIYQEMPHCAEVVYLMDHPPRSLEKPGASCPFLCLDLSQSMGQKVTTTGPITTWAYWRKLLSWYCSASVLTSDTCNISQIASVQQMCHAVSDALGGRLGYCWVLHSLPWRRPRI